MNDLERSAAGMAALTMCESLVLAMVEKRVIDAETVAELLEDAAATHRARTGHAIDRAKHEQAAKLIEQTARTLLASESA